MSAMNKRVAELIKDIGIKPLQKEYRESHKSFIIDVIARGNKDSDTISKAKHILKNTLGGDDKETCREAGYLRGIESAINILSDKINE